MRNFKCAKCGEEFRASNTEEEASREYEEIYNEPIGEEETVSLCSACYKWFLETSSKALL